MPNAASVARPSRNASTTNPQFGVAHGVPEDHRVADPAEEHAHAHQRARPPSRGCGGGCGRGGAAPGPRCRWPRRPPSRSSSRRSSSWPRPPSASWVQPDSAGAAARAARRRPSSRPEAAHGRPRPPARRRPPRRSPRAAGRRRPSVWTGAGVAGRRSRIRRFSAWRRRPPRDGRRACRGRRVPRGAAGPAPTSTSSRRSVTASPDRGRRAWCRARLRPTSSASAPLVAAITTPGVSTPSSRASSST